MKNIALIGFMGSGKTTVGKKLAQELKVSFVDTDDVIEEEAGKPIKQIFSDQGEDYFRKLERSVVGQVSTRDNQVIACGGGVVLDSGNVAALKKNGILIYLEASREAICNRVESSQQRPLLNVSDRENRVEELLCLREEIYREVADVTVDTSSLTIDQVVERIKKGIRSSAGEE